MGDGVKILFCMALLVLMTQGAILSNGDEFRSESRIQSASEKAVEGAVVSRKKRDFGLSTLLATVLIAGGSVASASSALASTDRLITVKIQTENYSKWRLGSPITHLESGSIRLPAAFNVLPGRLEAMVARKTGFTATGSWGTVSWLVDNNSGKRIIVMWSVPYDYNLYDNWLAVGIIDDADVGSGWTRHMYYAPHGDGHSFIRRKYSTSVHTITKCYAAMCVAGRMGTGHNSEVRIFFYPNNNDESNLAESVRADIARTRG